MKRIFKGKSKDENKKAIKFIAIWADDNGNGTFGVLASLCKTKEATTLQRCYIYCNFNIWCDVYRSLI